MFSTDQLRRQICQQRIALTETEKNLFATAICQHFIRSAFFATAKNIAGYYAIKGEADLTPIQQYIWQAGKNFFLPILYPLKENRLWFGRYQKDDQLLTNRFHIPEPLPTLDNLHMPWQLDLVLTPLVAFDDTGNRVGMSGGFYDRTFAFKQQKYRHKPILIGVAYEWQKVSSLTPQAWDVKLDAVVTNERWYFFK